MAGPVVDDVGTRMHRTHQQILLPVTAVLLAVGLLAGSAVPLDVQAWLLVVGVAVLGMPHGATDHLAGRSLLAGPCGGWWPLVFTAGYLGIAALVVSLWWLLAPLALAAFLLISIIHFGQEDSEQAPALGDWPGALQVPARGSLLIVGAMAWAPGEVGAIFGWLVGGVWAETLPAMLSPAQPWLLLVWMLSAALLTAGHGLESVRQTGRLRAGHLRSAVEVLLIALLPVVLPPLLAFIVYFCGWHSPRHFLQTASGLGVSASARALRLAAGLCLPLTLASWLLLGTAYGVVAAWRPPSEAMVSVVFVGLSALTVPHMLLSWLNSRRRSAVSAPRRLRAEPMLHRAAGGRLAAR